MRRVSCAADAHRKLSCVADSAIGNFRIETVTTDDAFAALQPAWNELVDRTTVDSVFLRHEWFAAAWAWRRHDAKLRILVARDGDAIIAILPLIAARTRDTRRVCALLTVPDTQRCDLIVAPEAVESASYALAKCIASQRDWDVLILDYLTPDGPILGHLAAQLTRLGVRTIVEERGRNPCIPLAGTWSAYWTSRSRSLKKACNLATNRLEKAGAVRIEHAGPGEMTDPQFDRATGAAIDISRRSWKQETGNSLDHEAPGDFIRSLSDAARRQGWLSVWLAYLDERPVAMEYQLVYRGMVHALRADFDADLERTSPGSYLFRHLLERMFGSGNSLYLMGPGENAYKTRWATDGDPLGRSWSYNRTIKGRFAYWFDRRAKPALRPVWHWVRRRR
jgi:CelD/BcsL family acetyltransferase involved in cellulose biosynthesis